MSSQALISADLEWPRTHAYYVFYVDQYFFDLLTKTKDLVTYKLGLKPQLPHQAL